jgi:hypothetical protein
MPVDPNLPIPQYPILEPTSAMTFSDLILEVAYKIGCAYYGADGTAAPSIPIAANDLAICQRIVNKAIRKFINDGPQPNGWRWLNVIAQVDLWPQISYDPTGGTFVTLTYNPTVNGTAYTGCTLLTLQTPPQPPYGTNAYPNGGPPQPNPLPVPPFGYSDGDTSYVPQFLASMELRQIWLNGNPPPTTPGWYLPIDEDYTGALIGQPFTVLRYISPTQLIVDGNATQPPVTAYNNLLVVPALVNTDSIITGTVTTSAGVATWSWLVSRGASDLQNQLAACSNVGAGKVTVTTTDSIHFAISFSTTTSTYLAYTPSTSSINYTGPQATAPFSFACSGDYTMPANFGGQYTGQITYVANTNRGMVLQWTSENAIRSRRQNYNIESGTPYEAAVRLMPTPSYQPLTNSAGLMLPRRRWELMTWRISSEFLSVLFPYTLSFNTLVNLTDVPPSPLGFDETLKACCLAEAEKEVDDTIQGTDWVYYHQSALPNAWQLDARSAPKKLGYFGNPTAEGTTQPIQAFRDFWYQRPTVPVFGQS